MIQVHPSTYEDDLNLLPGSELRDSALVDSIEQLKAQMNEANNKIEKKRSLVVIGATIVALVGLFVYRDKVGKGLKILGLILGIAALAKGASNAKNSFTQMPTSDDFSAKDRAYSYLDREYSSNIKTPKLIALIVSVVIGSLIAYRLIKPSEVREKQRLIKAKGIKVEPKLRKAILDYDTRK